MNRSNVFVFLALVAVLALTGCASGKSAVTAEREAGRNVVTRTYSVDVETAFKAAAAVMRWNEAEHYQEGKDHDYVMGLIGAKQDAQCIAGSFLLGVGGVTMCSYGAYAGVWIAQDGDGVRVDVAMKRAGIGRDPAVNEEDIQRQIAKALGILASGRPLPETMPTDSGASS